MKNTTLIIFLLITQCFGQAALDAKSLHEKGYYISYADGYFVLYENMDKFPDGMVEKLTQIKCDLVHLHVTGIYRHKTKDKLDSAIFIWANTYDTLRTPEDELYIIEHKSKNKDVSIMASRFPYYSEYSSLYVPRFAVKPEVMENVSEGDLVRGFYVPRWFWEKEKLWRYFSEEDSSTSN